MYYLITFITLFIALLCGFGCTLWMNKRLEKGEPTSPDTMTHEDR